VRAARPCAGPFLIMQSILNQPGRRWGYCLGSRVRLLRRLVGVAGGLSLLVTAAMAGGLAKLPWSAWYLITSSMSWLWVSAWLFPARPARFRR
jgi:hypothetical protein